MQKNKVILILLILFFVTTSIVSISYFFYSTIKIQEYGSGTVKPLTVEELIKLMKKLKWVL